MLICPVVEVFLERGQDSAFNTRFNNSHNAAASKYSAIIFCVQLFLQLRGDIEGGGVNYVPD